MAAGISGLLLLFVLAETAFGFKYESGGHFYLDTHGAGGVALVLEQLLDVDARYEAYYLGALDWIAANAVWEGDGCTWGRVSDRRASVSNAGAYPPATAFIAQQFLRAYQRTHREKYLHIAEGAVQWLMDVAIQGACAHGDTYQWRPRYHPRQKPSKRLLLSGYGHGLGSIGEGMLAVYRETRNTAIRPYLLGIANAYKQNAIAEKETNGIVPVHWVSYKNDPNVTGWCGGAAGSLDVLLSMADAFPEYRFADGQSILDLSNQGLAWLEQVSFEDKQGVQWKRLRNHQKGTSRNLGLGSGLAGIGLQFLKAADLNAGIHPELARRWRQMADRTLEKIVSVIQSASPPGNASSLGACAGDGGVVRFLKEYHDCRDASVPPRQVAAIAEKLGDAIVGLGLSFKEGVAWDTMDPKLQATEKKGEIRMPYWEKGSLPVPARHISLTIGHGNTGVAYVLANLGRWFGNEAFLEMAGRAGDFLIAHAVQDEHGYKWPPLIPYDGRAILEAGTPAPADRPAGPARQSFKKRMRTYYMPAALLVALLTGLVLWKRRA